MAVDDILRAGFFSWLMFDIPIVLGFEGDVEKKRCLKATNEMRNARGEMPNAKGEVQDAKCKRRGARCEM